MCVVEGNIFLFYKKSYLTKNINTFPKSIERTRTVRLAIKESHYYKWQCNVMAKVLDLE